MENVIIKRGVPTTVAIEVWDETVDPEIPYNLTGLTVFISVKKIDDNTNDDTLAVITSKITVHTFPLLGMTNWTLTAAQTLVHIGDYKADLKVYSGAVEMNSDIFYVKVEDVVTKRTS
jgi:hypothetical protein